ncbi:phosphomannomutase/phosphoglucomutase [Nitratireductor pacificus]|uniref:Phosphomannomutase n=1 Tax=Nitratireductor pacificus pht-3B TaxID=391937 RepID=K2N6N1_9HYPH|nr:phosphomannomutase/phosphoglucomutase [Nitratireductor pacificus]EKF19838.1 phosphomannomutase [Nitratireductor pacificus pht-3B]
MGAPFKAYDVRGRIPAEINVPFAYRFSQALRQSLSPKAVVVGHDMRSDSPALAQALTQGLLDSGVDVLPVGRCGTEEVYFHTAASGADAGLMVTASHNPMDYNGIKMVLKGAAAATPENAFNPIETIMRSDAVLATAATYDERGSLQPVCDRGAYIERLLNEVAGQALKPMKIVCHAGNGCAGPIIDLLEEHLPFTFIKIDHEPDPALPNGIPNPLLPEKRARASQAVIEHGADLAIAWDGDFDRCFLYDHKGRFVEGYYLVGMIAQSLLGKDPGGTILYDPRLTWNTIEVVEQAGGVAKPCRTGHAYFKKMMREENAVYGGEMSAHHYFRDFSYCDSGMLAWLDVVAELSKSGTTLAERLEERIAAYPCSGEINFTVDDAKAAQARVSDHFMPKNPELETIDGLGMVFDDWRFNLRASNTEPLLRLNVETRGDEALLAAKVAELRGLIEKEA